MVMERRFERDGNVDADGFFKRGKSGGQGKRAGSRAKGQCRPRFRSAVVSSRRGFVPLWF
jgi:hypothetical protein